MRYSPSHVGLARMLLGPEMRMLVDSRAQLGAQYAKSRAPVGGPKDPHRGSFRDSIHAVSGGVDLKGDRVAARVVADSTNASPVEFGNRRSKSAHTLRSTIPIIERGGA
jgi:hypothetical protein